MDKEITAVISKGVLFTHIKREILPLMPTLTSLQVLTVNTTSQALTDKCSFISLVHRLRITELTDADRVFVVEVAC